MPGSRGGCAGQRETGKRVPGENSALKRCKPPARVPLTRHPHEGSIHFQQGPFPCTRLSAPRSRAMWCGDKARATEMWAGIQGSSSPRGWTCGGVSGGRLAERAALGRTRAYGRGREDGAGPLPPRTSSSGRLGSSSPDSSGNRSLKLPPCSSVYSAAAGRFCGWGEDGLHRIMRSGLRLPGAENCPFFVCPMLGKARHALDPPSRFPP